MLFVFFKDGPITVNARMKKLILISAPPSLSVFLFVFKFGCRIVHGTSRHGILS